MNKRILQIKRFIEKSSALRSIIRFKGQKYWKDYHQPARHESTAEHSWRLSLLTLLASYELKEFDFAKAVKYAIIHDLVEVYAGDYPAHGLSGKGRTKSEEKYKMELEQKALEKLLAELPRTIADDIKQLWLEYENNSNFEAKVVNALDKIDGKFTAIEYSPDGLVPDHYEFTKMHGVKESKVSPFTEQLLNELLKDVKKQT